MAISASSHKCHMRQHNVMKRLTERACDVAAENVWAIGERASAASRCQNLAQRVAIALLCRRIAKRRSMPACMYRHDMLPPWKTATRSHVLLKSNVACRMHFRHDMLPHRKTAPRCHVLPNLHR